MADYLDYLTGAGETAATLGSGALAGLLGMPYGVYKGTTSGKLGTPEANRIAEEEAKRIMQEYTYQPRGKVAPEIMQSLGGLLEATKMPPVVPEAALLSSIPKAAYASQAERAGMAAERAVAPMVERTMAKGGLGAGLLGALTPQPMRAIEKSDLSYRGQHTAPGPDFGAPLHDLSQIYPDDIYSSKAAQYYGHSVPYDQKAASIMQQYKNKPNATVTIYRAVPKEMSNADKVAELDRHMGAYMRRGLLPQDAKITDGSKWYDWAHGEREKLRQMPDAPIESINAINAGDWVTLTRDYAKEHGESALRGQYKIISKKVKAKDIWTNADSIHEFGYQPQGLLD